MYYNVWLKIDCKQSYKSVQKKNLIAGCIRTNAMAICIRANTMAVCTRADAMIVYIKQMQGQFVQKQM